MTHFMFVTNTMNSTTYDGPSGERYIFYLAQPTKVTNKEDIKFFRKNKRFKETLSGKHKPLLDVDDILRAMLEEIKGITIETIEVTVEAYLTIDNLETAIMHRKQLHESISEEQGKLLIDHISKKKHKESTKEKKAEELKSSAKNKSNQSKTKKGEQ